MELATSSLQLRANVSQATGDTGTAGARVGGRANTVGADKGRTRRQATRRCSRFACLFAVICCFFLCVVVALLSANAISSPTFGPPLHLPPTPQTNTSGDAATDAVIRANFEKLVVAAARPPFLRGPRRDEPPMTLAQRFRVARVLRECHAIQLYRHQHSAAGVGADTGSAVGGCNFLVWGVGSGDDAWMWDALNTADGSGKAGRTVFLEDDVDKASAVRRRYPHLEIYDIVCVLPWLMLRIRDVFVACVHL